MVLLPVLGHAFACSPASGCLESMQACGAVCWGQWTTGPGSCAVAQQQLLL